MNARSSFIAGGLCLLIGAEHLGNLLFASGCPVCGYSTKGLAGPVCPECGAIRHPIRQDRPPSDSAGSRASH